MAATGTPGPEAEGRVHTCLDSTGTSNVKTQLRTGSACMGVTLLLVRYTDNISIETIFAAKSVTPGQCS